MSCAPVRQLRCLHVGEHPRASKKPRVYQVPSIEERVPRYMSQVLMMKVIVLSNLLVLVLSVESMVAKDGKLALVAIYISIYIVSTERSKSADKSETRTPKHSLHSSPAEKVPTLYSVNTSTHFALLQSRCPHHIPAHQTTCDAHPVPVAVVKYYQMHAWSE